MKKQRVNSHTVRWILLLGLLSAYLTGCEWGKNLVTVRFDSVFPESADPGELVTVTVSVVGNAGGSPVTGQVDISFDWSEAYPNSHCTVNLVNGSATCQIAPVPRGGYQPIRAVYKGDSHYYESGATYDYFIDSSAYFPTPDTLSTLSIISHGPDPSRLGEFVEFKVRLLSSENTSSLCKVLIQSMYGRVNGRGGCFITLSNGEGSCQSEFTIPGEQSVGAWLICDGDYTGVSTSVLQHVSWLTQVTLSVTPDPPVAGQPVQVSVTVSIVDLTGNTYPSAWGNVPIPAGTVSVGYGSQAVCPDVPLVDGSASCQFVFAEAGEQTIHALYIPHANGFFQESETSLLVNVQPAVTPTPTATPTPTPRPTPKYIPPTATSTPSSDGGGSGGGSGGAYCFCEDGPPDGIQIGCFPVDSCGTCVMDCTP